MSAELTGRDVITVDRDGEEIEVYNHVTVTKQHYVNSVNGHDSFDGPVEAGDGGIGEPDAVTPRIAYLLDSEFGVDVEQHGIEVIDPEDDEVTVL